MDRESKHPLGASREKKMEGTPAVDPSNQLVIEECLARPTDAAELHSSVALVVKAKHGQTRPDHGLALQIHSPLNNAQFFSMLHNISINVHSRELFNRLPLAVGLLAPSVLPITVGVVHHKNYIECNLGATQVSRNRILDTLQNVGNVPFVLEIRRCFGRGDGELIGFVPTTGAHLLASMGSSDASFHADIRYRGPLNASHFRVNNVLNYVNWWKWWLLFCVGVWTLALEPALAAPLAPFALFATPSASLTDALPLCPSNMEIAFLLGDLHRRLLDALRRTGDAASGGGAAVAALLAEAEALTGRSVGTVSVSDVEGVLSQIRLLNSDSAGGLIGSVTGFFSFVNMLWLLAVAGVAVSLGPSLYHVLAPLRNTLRRLCSWLFHSILLPVALRLHSWGVAEAGAYALAWALVAEAVLRMPRDADAAVFVALSGVVLSVVVSVGASGCTHGWTELVGGGRWMVRLGGGGQIARW